MEDRTQRIWGIVNCKYRWRLSWRGWFLVMVASIGLGLFSVLTIHPFLAVTHRLPAKSLVVEGWIDDYGIRAAAHEFDAGHYVQIYTTGGPAEGYGPNSSIYDTEAYQTAGHLKRIGVPSERVQSVPSCFVGKDRTYNSALALRDWFRTNNLPIKEINVLTEDAHARRTWMLFQKALGPDIKVGIISVPDPDYDAKHWWRSSEGVREVLDEGIAYIYARFFFWP